jgi:hypothetical protein
MFLVLRLAITALQVVLAVTPLLAVQLDWMSISLHDLHWQQLQHRSHRWLPRIEWQNMSELETQRLLFITRLLR